MHRSLFAYAAVGALLLSPLAIGEGLIPVNPVLNGDFEASLSLGAFPGTQGLLDHCIGIGHQVFYGSETAVGKTEADAVGLAADAQAPGFDPTSLIGFTPGALDHANADDTVRFVGVDSCEYSASHGYDIAWVNPYEKSEDGAVHWSNDPATRFDDMDGDGDREAYVPKGNGGGHSLWQAYPSPFQAWTPDATAFSFRVENGATPAGAVHISLSATPLEAQTPWVLLWIECTLVIDNSLIRASMGSDGVVSIDPAHARLVAADPACDGAAAEFAAGDEETRHEVLSRLRMVQLSFWSFNRGSTDIVIDDVGFVNAATAAEGAVGVALGAAGN